MFLNRKKLVFMGVASIGLVSILLFQNCGNVKLNGGQQIASVEDPIDPTEPIKIGGDAPEYACVTNDSVPEGHDGLTMADRKTSALIWSSVLPLTPFETTQWTSIFGVFVGPGQISQPDGSIRVLNFPGPAEQGYGFPGSNAFWREMDFEVGKFMALKFRVPSDPSWHGVQPVLGLAPANGGRSAVYSFSVSKCPGQFRNVASAPPIRDHCSGYLESADANIFFVIEDPSRPYTGSRCALTAGESYYFNLIPVNAEVPGNLNPALAAELTGYSDYVDLHISRPPMSVSTEY